MAEHERACSRCGSSSNTTPTTMEIVAGPLSNVFPELHLCPWCTHSLSRWMERKKQHRHRSSGHSHSQRSHRSDRREEEDLPSDDRDKAADEPRDERTAGQKLKISAHDNVDD